MLTAISHAGRSPEAEFAADAVTGDAAVVPLEVRHAYSTMNVVKSVRAG